MMKVHPQIISLEKFEEWQKLFRDYRSFYGQSVNERVEREVWKWIQQGVIVCRGAFVENGLVGFIHWRAFPHPLSGKMALFVDDLFVTPEMRGKGCGRALMEAAKGQDYPFVRWLTTENNLEARALYDRVGTETGLIAYGSRRR